LNVFEQEPTEKVWGNCIRKKKGGGGEEKKKLPVGLFSPIGV